MSNSHNVVDIRKPVKHPIPDKLLGVCEALYAAGGTKFDPKSAEVKAIAGAANALLRAEEPELKPPAGLNRREKQYYAQLRAVQFAASELSVQYLNADSIAATALRTWTSLLVPRRMRTCQGYLQHCLSDLATRPVTTGVIPESAAKAGDAILTRPVILSYAGALRMHKLCQPGEHMGTMLFRVACAVAYQHAWGLADSERDSLFQRTLSELVQQRILLSPTLMDCLGVRSILTPGREMRWVVVWSRKMKELDPPKPPPEGIGFMDILVPDYFMRRVDSDGDWMLFGDEHSAELYGLRGNEFEAAYTLLEKRAEAGEINGDKVRAREIWLRATRWATDSFEGIQRIHIRFTDAAKALGMSMCRGELLKQVPAGAVNVAAHATEGVLDDEGLAESTRVLTCVLDRLSDRVEIPDIPTRRRPLAISVCGVADVCLMLGQSYWYPMSVLTHEHVQSVVANAAAAASHELGDAFGSFNDKEENAWAQGKLPQDLFQDSLNRMGPGAEMYQASLWEAELRDKVKESMRNIRLCGDYLYDPDDYGFYGDVFGTPHYGDVYPRAIWTEPLPHSADMPVKTQRRANPWMTSMVSSHGAWSPQMCEAIEVSGGSVQGVQLIPPEIRQLLLCGTEIPGFTLISMAAMRQRFMSGVVEFTIYVPETRNGVDHIHISQAYFYAWQRGLVQTPRCITQASRLEVQAQHTAAG